MTNKIQTFSLKNVQFQVNLIKDHGHSASFNSLLFFIQQFLKEISSFLTFLLSDQLIFDHLSHHHRSNFPLIYFSNNNDKFNLIRNRACSFIHETLLHQFIQVQFQQTDADSTRELDKGRGARITSIKTLSTLIPLIMCFDCGEPFNIPKHQVVHQYEEINQITNCINIQEKSIIIIQVSENIHFLTIKKLKKLSALAKGYSFYEKNKLLNNNQIITEGVHYIHYRSCIKGGNPNAEVWNEFFKMCELYNWCKEQA
jgi:hypothetical protein